MLKIIEVVIDETVQQDCNGGNYPEVLLLVKDMASGEVTEWHGKTCRCRLGCSNTWRLVTINSSGWSVPITEYEFDTEEDLEYFLRS